MLRHGWAAFAAGVSLLLFLPSLPDPAWPALTAMVLLGIGLRYRGALLGACLCAGLAWGVWHAARYQADVLPVREEGVVHRVEVRIAGLPAPARHARLRLRVSPLLSRQPLKGWPPGRYWELNAPPADYRPGERWLVTVVLKQPRGTVSPGAFDAEEWWMTEGVIATGVVREAIRLEAAGWSPDSIRLGIRERFAPLVADKPQAAVTLALLTGDRALIADDQEALYRDTGIMHLMAISGPHVLLFATAVAWLVRGLLGRHPVWFRTLPFHRLKWPILLVAAIAYGLLAGATLPTLRTLIMLAVCALSALGGRLSDPWGILGRALAAVLLWQPLSVHAAGFWLSFGAVAILMLAGPGSLTGWRQWTRLQLTLFVALLPLSLLFFGQVSLVAPLANLVAVPLIGWGVVPLAITGLLLHGVWEHAGMACWYWAGCLLERLESLLGFLVSGPVSTWAWQPGTAGLVFLSLAVLVLLAPRRFLPRELALLLALPAFFTHEALPEGALRLSVLDVGQGLAVLVETRQHNLLYDTGPTPSAGERVVLPYLSRAGIRKIEELMLSHNDLDHTGGAASLVERLPVGRLTYSAVPDSFRPGATTRQSLCRAGERWRWDRVEFTLLAPLSGMSRLADNDRSCVLRIAGEGFSILLTGDIERPAESRLLAEGVLAPVDVLVLPHHGSRTSSSEAFVAALRPRRGVVSAGYRNRFGHPHRQVVGRYLKMGTRLDSTVEGGTLVYEWRPGRAMTLERWRDRRHYWRIPP